MLSESCIVTVILLSLSRINCGLGPQRNPAVSAAHPEARTIDGWIKRHESQAHDLLLIFISLCVQTQISRAARLGSFSSPRSLLFTGQSQVRRAPLGLLNPESWLPLRILVRASLQDAIAADFASICTIRPISDFFGEHRRQPHLARVLTAGEQWVMTVFSVWLDSLLLPVE
jgi:hypothetical protein